MEPFDEHTADTGVLESTASELGRLANRALDERETTQRAFDPAVDNWEGIAAPELREAGEQALRPAFVASSAIAWAAVPLRYWASKVTEFNAKVGLYKASWSEEVAALAAVDVTNATMAYEVSTARSTITSRWHRAWYDAYETDILDGAETVASMLAEGPTEENLRLARAAGAIPLEDGAFTVFPLFWQRSPAVDQLIDSLIQRGVLPPEFAFMSAEQAMQYLEDHPELARRLTEAIPGGTSPLEWILRDAIGPWMTSDEVDPMEMAREVLSGLAPGELAWLAMLFPSVVGNLPGAPYSGRITANRVRIVAELDRLRHSEDPSQERIDLYEAILRDDRQIIYFDPRGDGAMAELHGSINASTRNVGIYVEGAGTELDRYGDAYARARSFYLEAERNGGGLAMITWVGGDFPEAGSAALPTAADRLGPRLADFSHELRQEMNANAGDGARIGVVGHSYGGPIVGTAEANGMDANRVLHIGSAGMGSGIDSVDEYTNPNRNVQRFAMSAPGDDTFDVVRGAGEVANDIFEPLPGSPPIGLGDVPDDNSAFTQLDTGRYPAGHPNAGELVTGHDDTLIEHTGSWNNLYEFYTGGTVTTPPEVVCVPHGPPPGTIPQNGTVPDPTPDCETVPGEAINVR